MPATKRDNATARVIGAGVLGNGGILSLELESPELAAERAVATEILTDIMQLPAHTDLAHDHMDLTLGHFPGGVDEQIAIDLTNVAAPFVEGHTITLAPLPDPRQTPAQG
jgi:hypothetical protein